MTNYVAKNKDLSINLLREALVKIHDDPYNRDMIVSVAYDALTETKPDEEPPKRKKILWFM